MNQSKPKVSIIIPTRNRLNLLPEIIKCYANQTWKNRELLILDDTPGGEKRIKNLEKLGKNIHIYHSNKSLNIEAKCNLLISKSEGDFIAYFKDCNYYSPRYIETLTQALLTSKANLVKLAGWFCLHEASNTLGYWDSTRHDLPNTIFTAAEEISTNKIQLTREKNQFFRDQYSFSCLHRKQRWKELSLKHASHTKGTACFREIHSEPNQTILIQDNSGLCLQIINKANKSRCFPNHIIPEALKYQYFPFLQEKIKSSNSSKLGKSIKSNNSPSSPLTFCATKNDWNKSSPVISICTITHNRKLFLPQLQKCIESQNYPICNIEWVILDDSTEYLDALEFKTNTDLRIKYQRVKHKLPLGRKRNLSHQLCSGDYIVYMDDDDYYPPSRVSHAISSLQETGKEIAGSTLLQIYFCHDKQLWLSGPFGTNHATAGTFAMTKDFARQNHYRNEDICNEEKHFLRNYTTPMVQLDPTQTMICISHNSNTFDKKRMRANGATRTMRRTNEKILSSNVLGKLQAYESIHARMRNESD